MLRCCPVTKRSGTIPGPLGGEMDTVLIEEEELNLLLIMYDYVKGFGEAHWFCPKAFKEHEGIDLMSLGRPLSFLAEHGLVVADRKTPDSRRKALFARQEQIAPQVREQERRRPHYDGNGWAPLVGEDEHNYVLEKKRLQEERWSLPIMMVYVTGLGANYVRQVRSRVEQELKPVPQPGRKRSGLKEMPGPAGEYVRKALSISRDVVIQVAGNILASLITGK
jgi:hypothetical protein